MNSIYKKSISALVCLIMLVVTVVPISAQAEKTAFIVVSGMNSFPLENDEAKQIYPFPTDAILGMVKDLITPVSEFFITRDADKLGDSVLPVVRDCFEPIACNADGDSLNAVTTREYKGNLSEYISDFEKEETDELAIVRRGIEYYGAENTYFFNYDWRLDPLVHADKLNELITNIKSSGKNTRIALSAFSMGGTVVCSYLYKYGSEAIDSLSLCSTAFQGTSSVGSLYTGDFKFSMDGLMRRLAQLTRDEFFENLVKYLNTQLSLSGINSRIENFTEELTIELNNRVYAELLIPIFGYMPGFWALVDDINYEQAKSFMLAEDASDVLRSRIDDYHYNVQYKAEELFKVASSDTDIYIVAQYNMQGLPISETSTNSNNDYLIDTTYASGGAICAPIGEKLEDGYIQQYHTEKNYLSPDGQIDASTCMLPERTWFIRDMGHVDYPYGEAADFVIYLSANSALTVENTEYSQFMSYDYKNGKLSAVTENENNSLSDKLFAVMTDILVKLFDIFNKLFSSFTSGVC